MDIAVNIGINTILVALKMEISLLPMLLLVLMLQTGMSIAFKSSGILKVLYNVQPPVRSVAVILLDAVTNAILLSDLIVARIRLNRKVLPVSPLASKNSTPP